MRWQLPSSKLSNEEISLDQSFSNSLGGLGGVKDMMPAGLHLQTTTALQIGASGSSRPDMKRGCSTTTRRLETRRLHTPRLHTLSDPTRIAITCGAWPRHGAPPQRRTSAFQQQSTDRSMRAYTFFVLTCTTNTVHAANSREAAARAAHCERLTCGASQKGGALTRGASRNRGLDGR